MMRKYLQSLMQTEDVHMHAYGPEATPDHDLHQHLHIHARQEYELSRMEEEEDRTREVEALALRCSWRVLAQQR